MLNRLYDISQVPAHLRHVVQKGNLLPALARSLTDRATAADIARLMEGVFEVDEMNAIARSHFIAQWDFPLGSRALGTFQQQPHSRLLQLEADAAAPFAKEGLREFMAEVDPEADEQRLELVVGLDEAMRATEWMAAFLHLIAEELTSALAARPFTADSDPSEPQAIADALRAQVEEYRAGSPGVWLLLYAYREERSTDLELFLEALQRDEGEWLMRTSRDALVHALRPGLQRYAGALAKLL